MTIPTIASEHLVEFATAVYVSAGMPLQDARLLADTLVQAVSLGPPISRGIAPGMVSSASAQRRYACGEQAASAYGWRRHYSYRCW